MPRQETGLGGAGKALPCSSNAQFSVNGGYSVKFGPYFWTSAAFILSEVVCLSASYVTERTNLTATFSGGPLKIAPMVSFAWQPFELHAAVFGLK
jgi:hypothetical protein